MYFGRKHDNYDQYFKGSTIIIYDSRVEMTLTF